MRNSGPDFRAKRHKTEKGLGQGATYAVHLRLIGKLVVDFLLLYFFRYVLSFCHVNLQSIYNFKGDYQQSLLSFAWLTCLKRYMSERGQRAHCSKMQGVGVFDSHFGGALIDTSAQILA